VVPLPGIIVQGSRLPAGIVQVERNRANPGAGIITRYAQVHRADVPVVQAHRAVDNRAGRWYAHINTVWIAATAVVAGQVKGSQVEIVLPFC